MTKAKRSFADIAAKREHYDPVKEGYGSVREWQGTFYRRMGFDKAVRIMEEARRTPRQILGLGLACTWADVKSAYRARAMECHPDRIEITGMTKQEAEDAFNQLSAAVSVLAREFGQ